jgi:hypothetical protein
MCCILVHLRAAHRTLNPVPGPRRNKSPSFYHLIKIIWYKILVVHLEVPWPYQKETLHERLELRVQIAYTEARTKSANSTHRCINHMGMRACYHPSSRVHPHWGCVYGTILPAGPCATLFWFTHRWLQSTQTNKVPWPYQMEIELGSLQRVHTKLFGSPTQDNKVLNTHQHFISIMLSSRCKDAKLTSPRTDSRQHTPCIRFKRGHTHALPSLPVLVQEDQQCLHANNYSFLIGVGFTCIKTYNECLSR